MQQWPTFFMYQWINATIQGCFLPYLTKSLQKNLEILFEFYNAFQNEADSRNFSKWPPSINPRFTYVISCHFVLGNTVPEHPGQSFARREKNAKDHTSTVQPFLEGQE